MDSRTNYHLVRFLPQVRVEMNLFVITCLLAIAASAKGNGAISLGGPIYAPGHATANYYSYPSYAFEYSVKDPHTGDNKAQWEKRDGDAVKGAYSLVEPDGSLRVVEYWADDKSGFNAVVKRLGPNLHPTGPVLAPYKATIPILSSPHAAPISVGPVSKLAGLEGAPLLHGPAVAPIITGPLLGSHGGALSSASVYKGAPIAVKTIAPPLLHEPILPAPIIKEHFEPIPIIKPAPIYHTLSAPIAKPGPILTDYPLSGLFKGPFVEPSYYKGPVLEPSYAKGPLLESTYIKNPLEPGLVKAPIIEPVILKPHSPYGPGPLLNWGDLGYKH